MKSKVKKNGKMKMRMSTNIFICVLAMIVLAVSIFVYFNAKKYQQYEKVSAKITDMKVTSSSVICHTKKRSNKTGGKKKEYYAQIIQNLKLEYEFDGKKYKKDLNNRECNGSKHSFKTDAQKDLDSKSVVGYYKKGEKINIYTNGDDLAEVASVDSDANAFWGIVACGVFIVISAIYQILSHFGICKKNGKKKTNTRKDKDDTKNMI